MRSVRYFLFSVLFVLIACGGAGKGTSGADVREELEAKNRMTTSLLDQIRRLPGVVIKNGVPVFIKGNSSIPGGGSQEPLYILNDYIVGNSFRDVGQLVENINVSEIQVLSASEASFYGSRAGNGVIKITTRK